MKEVVVSKKAARELAAGAVWVYRSDIADKKRFIPGELVRVVDERGRFLAVGYINPNSTIAIRVLSRKDEPIDAAFFERRLEIAESLRSPLDATGVRLVHSEADMLPGLIVDRYDTILSVHFTTAGMAAFRPVITDLLQKRYEPAGMVVRFDETAAKREGVEGFSEEVGLVEPVIITENGVRFWVDAKEGQKTGFYLDQRKNRLILSQWLPEGGSMLDCFSNTGGFGLYGAVKRKASVRLVDVSEKALELARKNFELNGAKGEFVAANVFDYLREIRGREVFDMVVLDPPSFAKTKAQKDGALRGFKDIAANGVKVTKDGGYIALFSCSHHIGLEDLRRVMQKAAADNKKRLVVVEHLFQDIDHPVVVGIPNSLYLTGLLCRVLQ
jgi:23S rRNA (cytosine1962-C5)-methyltransferase